VANVDQVIQPVKFSWEIGISETLPEPTQYSKTPLEGGVLLYWVETEFT